MTGDMPSDDTALIKQIVNELTAMRRARARIKIDLLQAPTVVWHLGRGDVEVASLFLEHLSRADDVPVRAALASLGFGNWEMTIEDRIQHFAHQYRVSASTMRRMADEGFHTVARMIIEWSREEGNDRPLADIKISPDGDASFIVRVECSWQHKSFMFPPTIEFLTQTPEVVEEATLDDQEGPELFRLVVRAALPAGDANAEFCVTWLGPAECYYYLEISPGFRATSVASMTTKKGCDIRMWLVGQEGAD